MTSSRSAKFVCLAILDGWGMAPPSPGNAISLAKTENIDRFWISYPHTQLSASGEAVGLPRAEPGNTETGHLNLGAGRIVYQHLARINMAIADGTFFTNPVLQGAINHAKSNNSNLHLMGLIGAGGVHTSVEHLLALIQLAARQKFSRVYLHLFTDGRDSPPTSALTYILQIKETMQKEGVGTIASIIGRYWAMDRDRRWERTAKAYFALTQGKGHLAKTAAEAVELSYSLGNTDEFIEPTLLVDKSGAPTATVKDKDAVIFFNFRIDRPRQLTSAFVSRDFSKDSLAQEYDPHAIEYEKKHLVDRELETKTFERGKPLENLYFVMMTEYGKRLIEAGAKVAFPPEIIELSLGRFLSDADLRQLRVAESEKERFVTFYFNGRKGAPFPGEERIIIPSPKVPTYDQKPEMSAREITDALLERLKAESEYTFILINFANPDMVGHTGNITPAVKACEVVDECIGKIANHISAYEGVLLITADHGNVEEMINVKTGEIDTEHSTNPVPFIAVSKSLLGKSQMLRTGILADVAPTVLNLLGITPLESMTGRDLLKEVWEG